MGAVWVHMQSRPIELCAVRVTVCRSLTLANGVLRPVSNGQAARRATCDMPATAARMLMSACERMRHACWHDVPRACAAAPRRAAGTVGTAAVAPKKPMALASTADSLTNSILSNASPSTRAVRSGSRERIWDACGRAAGRLHAAAAISHDDPSY